MLTEQQLNQAAELFQAAVNYNAAIHAAFVSTDDMVTVKLAYEGRVEEVSIPTYHYLLSTVDKLAKTVAQLQVSDDGSDVVQLLTTAGNLTLLYLQKRQMYVQAPVGAELLKYDYETRPTEYSSADRTALYVDLTKCKLPMDAQWAIATLDDGQPMQLPIQFKTTTFDKIANVLAVSGSGDNKLYMVDSNDLQVGTQVQCHSTIYQVTAISGQSIQLSCLQPTVIQEIVPGDVLYTITDASIAILEVPVYKMHSKLDIQIQYMGLLSTKATYSLDGMQNAIHQTLRVALKDVLKGASNLENTAVLGTAVRPMASDLASILANSIPKVTKTTVRQTNTHQYIHSAVETMVKTNAILVQAKEDIQRLEELIATTTTNLLASGADVENNATLLAYNDQLASARNRYLSAQASLASMNVSAQAVRPEYAATIYMEPNDSAGMPVVQYVARYQYLSLTVNDVSNDWQYIYSNKRTINENGELMHDIDDYNVLNSIQLPIHAYEQLVVEVAAILQYGQPLLTVQTGWTNTLFLTIPEQLLKEVSVDEMFKNAYEAKLYTNVQQAMEAAGVFRHINTNVTYAHRAQDIQYDNYDTIYTKIQSMIKDITALQTTASTTALNVYVRYNGIIYPVLNGSQLELTAASSYYEQAFGNRQGDELQNALGTVIEENVEILIVNNSSDTIYLHSMIPGNATNVLSESKWSNYANLPIIVSKDNVTIGTTSFKYNRVFAATEAMKLYRGVVNAAGNRNLAILSNADFNNTGRSINTMLLDGSVVTSKYINNGAFSGQTGAIIAAGYQNGQELGITGNVMYDYPGIGIHEGFPLFYGLLDEAGNIRPAYSSMTTAELDEYAQGLDMAEAIANRENIFNTDKYYLAAKRLGLEFPLVTGFSLTTDPEIGGGSLLAADYIQPAIFDAANDDRDYAAKSITKFDPEIHKYTSGRASRGAFFYIDALAGLGTLQLPAYGTSNAEPIAPATADDTYENAVMVNCKFQARMTDRVGLTDVSAKVATDGNGKLIPAKTGDNFKYRKTINLSVKTGLTSISFDITFTMPWLQ